MKDRDQEAKQLIMDYRFTFGSDEGKRVLADIERLAKFNLSIVPLDQQGRIDPMAVMRNEGQRSVLVHIYRKLKQDPNEKKQKVAK